MCKCLCPCEPVKSVRLGAKKSDERIDQFMACPCTWLAGCPKGREDLRSVGLVASITINRHFRAFTQAQHRHLSEFVDFAQRKQDERQVDAQVSHTNVTHSAYLERVARNQRHDATCSPEFRLAPAHDDEEDGDHWLCTPASLLVSGIPQTSGKRPATRR